MDRFQGGLFPTRTSCLIFFSYISLFVSQGLLTTATNNSQITGFNSSIVVLLTELLKLIICTSVYLIQSNWSFKNLFNDIALNKRLTVLYLIPALLYCMYNNLTFTNLERFDLATYYCLMQFRIVLTAIIYQILFRRKLSSIQWASLFILTIGCLIKEYSLYDKLPQHTGASTHTTKVLPASNWTMRSVDDSDPIPITKTFYFLSSTLLILLQLFCSCFAGVYNEYLLKDSSTAKDADVILQNIFMYLDSIVCNALFFQLIPHMEKHVSDQNITIISRLQNLLTNPLICVLILNNALSGLVASFFLKSLNSIIKTFAAALELFAVTFLAWLLFDDHIDGITIFSLIVVTLALALYSMNPVSVAPPTNTGRPNTRDGFMLLSSSEV